MRSNVSATRMSNQYRGLSSTYNGQLGFTVKQEPSLMKWTPDIGPNVKV